jgi:hypothetical protein
VSAGYPIIEAAFYGATVVLMRITTNAMAEAKHCISDPQSCDLRSAREQVAGARRIAEELVALGVPLGPSVDRAYQRLLGILDTAATAIEAVQRGDLEGFQQASASYREELQLLRYWLARMRPTG